MQTAVYNKKNRALKRYYKEKSAEDYQNCGHNRKTFAMKQRRCLEAASSSWKICIDQSFRNCSRIYPTQQKKVAFLINELKKNIHVKQIIIFGSSVNKHCHHGSDVDLYVFLDKDVKITLSACPFVYDLWTNYTVDQRLLDEITKKGVIVYERDII